MLTNKTQEMPVYLNVKQVAEVMGFSERYTYEFVEQNGFPLIRIGRTKRVKYQDLIDWIESHKTTKEA